MFRETIDKPIEPISVEYFKTIQRIENAPDYSLDCLGVALIKSRVENYKGVQGVYCSVEKTSSALNDFATKIHSENDVPLFCFYRYGTNNVTPKDVEDIIPEFKEKKSVYTFIRTNTGNECFVYYHENKNQVCIMINSRDIRLYHLLLSFVSLYYPAIFKDKPLIEEEYNIVKSLSKDTKDPFVAAVKVLIEPYAYEMRKIQLGYLMKMIHENKIAKALQEVNSARQAMLDMQRRYATAIELVKSCVVTYEGMKATESYDEVEEEFIDYLSKTKELHNIEIDGSILKFSVATLLNNYNENAWETFSKRGGIYDGDYKTRLLDVFKVLKNRKLLLDHIFSESPDFVVKIAGNYRINLSSCSISADRYYDYNEADPIYKDYIPNPHLKIFACLGGYENKIMNALQERNYIAAIELCVASAGSVDLDETDQTFRPFLGWLLSTQNKVLRTKDGKDITPEEALVWLIDKEKENEAN